MSDNHANLVASHPGNVSAVKHGLWSPRVLAPRAQEVSDALAELPHAMPIDSLAIAEVASLVARLEAVDRDLDERGHFGRNGARSLLQHRARLSRELRAWLVEIGATPRSRAQFANALSRGSLGEEIRRRLEAVVEAETEEL